MHQFIHACAGAGKTQSIVDRCINDESVRRLIITLTLTGQSELKARLRDACSPTILPNVSGWYSFLIHHCIRPYLPLVFPDVRVAGFSYPPEDNKEKQRRAEQIRYTSASSHLRFFNSNWCIYKETIEELALKVMQAADGKVEERLARIYDELIIDEVQDVSRKGLDIIERLIKQKGFNFYAVGDTRQSLLDSGLFSTGNKKFDRLGLINWYRKHEDDNLLNITEKTETFRSNLLIARFSDTIFRAELAFSPSTSANPVTTGHDGVFVVQEKFLEEYMERYMPVPLRGTAATAKHLSHLGFKNIGKVKGRTFDRVLIAATGPIDKFLHSNEYLSDKSACNFYVGVTRARFSVAIVPKNPTKPFLKGLPLTVQVWDPSM